jgi:hypothetical protein
MSFSPGYTGILALFGKAIKKYMAGKERNWIISNLVEGQGAGIYAMDNDPRGPGGEAYCLQS